jgi:WD40 repeat protein
VIALDSQDSLYLFIKRIFTENWYQKINVDLHQLKHWANGVIWSPDGQTIASASSDKTVIFRHLADLQLELNRLMVSACD